MGVRVSSRHPGYDPEAFARGLRDANPDAKGPWGEFGRETIENTTTWGGTTNLSFVGPTSSEASFVQSTQLVHVSRRRPTNFTLMTLITLGQGWTGETSTLVLAVIANIGVGQAVAYAKRIFNVPPAALINGAQVVLDLFSPIPATALNTQVQLVSFAAINPVHHDLQVTQLAAPLVQ